MSKLLKFKNCVTLEESAHRLSALIGESVSVNELIEFAIDGHLTLSIMVEDAALFRVELRGSPGDGLFHNRFIKDKPDHMLSGPLPLFNFYHELESEKKIPAKPDLKAFGITVGDQSEAYACYAYPTEYLPQNQIERICSEADELTPENVAKLVRMPPPELFLRPPLNLVIQPNYLLEFADKVNGKAVEPTVLAPKTKNKYLRTISALSTALIKGLTHEPSKDAVAILKELELAGVQAPLDAKTLSKYLSEADKLAD